MTQPITLKEGDRVVCTHYKDKPICVVTAISFLGGSIWVCEESKYIPENFDVPLNWWGPREWFRKIRKRQHS